MGSMNKGGNGRHMCTSVCNPKYVQGLYYCDMCKTWTDEKRCICCGLPVAPHSVYNTNSVAGINRQQQNYARPKQYVTKDEMKRRKR